jgi:hypothetical protein
VFDPAVTQNQREAVQEGAGEGCLEEDSYALYCGTVNVSYVEQSSLLNDAAGDQVLLEDEEV